MNMRQDMHQQQSMFMRLRLFLNALLDKILSKIRVPAGAMESFLFGAIGVWTVVFFWNDTLFELSPIIYAPMKEKGPPSYWGWQALTLIVLWLAAVRFQNVTLRYIALVFLCGWYYYLAAMFIGTGVVSFGGGIHLLGLFYAGWTLWRFAGRKHDPKQ